MAITPVGSDAEGRLVGLAGRPPLELPSRSESEYFPPGFVPRGQVMGIIGDSHTDLFEVNNSRGQHWWKYGGLQSGATLVRPDGHSGWGLRQLINDTSRTGGTLTPLTRQLSYGINTLVVCSGPNDAVQGVSAQEFKDLMRQIRDACEAKNVQMVILWAPPLLGNHQIDDSVRNQFGVLRRAARDAAVELGVPYKDIWDQLGHVAPAWYDGGDRLHWSPAGHKDWADRVTPFLERCLGSAPLDWTVTTPWGQDGGGGSDGTSTKEVPRSADSVIPSPIVREITCTTLQYRFVAHEVTGLTGGQIVRARFGAEIVNSHGSAGTPGMGGVSFGFSHYAPTVNTLWIANNMRINERRLRGGIQTTVPDGVTGLWVFAGISDMDGPGDIATVRVGGLTFEVLPAPE